jgi:Protein of unknown function (DUF1496)
MGVTRDLLDAILASGRIMQSAAVIWPVRERGISMRVISVSLALSAVLAPGIVFAQNQPSPSTNYKGLTKDDLKTVCLYNDNIYSAGSIICVGKGIALFCGTEKVAGWSIDEKNNPACAK